MTYTIIEMQTTGSQTAVVTPISYTDSVEAEAVFLEKCAAARRSAVPTHTVLLIDQEGNVIARKCFKK